MQNRPIIIGVTGGSGGGKTSVSKAILSYFPNEKIAMPLSYHEIKGKAPKQKYLGALLRLKFNIS